MHAIYNSISVHMDVCVGSPFLSQVCAWFIFVWTLACVFVRVCDLKFHH